MSPEERHQFEAIWPDLAVRLDAFLARKRVPIDQREDLVQETGARLVAMWDGVDQSRPTWPLAMTVALNLVRDRARRGFDREVASEIPDLPALYDVESAGLARIELAQVRDALPALSSRQRAAVLAEVGYAVGVEPGTNADKMTRSRARRKLSLIVGRISAAVSLQYRRLTEFLQALAGGGEGALGGLGCTACAVLAMSAVLVPHPTAAVDLGRIVGSDGVSFAVPVTTSGVVAGADLALSGAASRALAPERERIAAPAPTRRSLSRRMADGSTATGSGSGTAPTVGTDSARITAPTAPEAPNVPEAPPVPGRDPDGGDVPQPPRPDVVEDVVEEVGQVASGAPALPSLPK